MLVYGDSITNGYDAKYTSNAYISQVADAFDLEIINKAIGGEGFFPTLSKAKSNLSPDYILVSYGTNDWAFSTQDDFALRCNEFFKNLTVNYPEAIRLLTMVSKTHVGACYTLGVCQEEGRGVVVADDREAIKYYRKAQKLGHNKAAAKVAMLEKRLQSRSEAD